MADAQTILMDLYKVIVDRRENPPESSYVATLFREGAEAIAAKLREECEEVIAAAEEHSYEHVVYESADALFHLMILMASRHVPLEAVAEELARRFGIGGLDEKAQRGSS
jgi:phosphoribosyl-ATP pyrophosphohydrolase